MQGYALSDSGSAEQRHTARAFHALAICCNIATVVYYVVVVVALIVILSIYFGTQYSIGSNEGGCYYSTCDDRVDYYNYGDYGCSYVCA